MEFTQQLRAPVNAAIEMTTPKVSVIMPIYNVVHFLEQSIESVVAQTFDDWELLIVDDASDDGGRELAAGYVERFPGKIRLLEHEGRTNCGIAATRALGLKHARASYLAPLDGDDIWTKNKLADQVAILEKHPEVGMIIADTVRWRSWTSGNVHSEHDRVYGSGQEKNQIYHAPRLMAALYPLGEGPPPSMSGLIVRTDAVKAVGGFTHDIESIYEDQAILVKLYNTISVYVADGCWDYYRQHPHSIVARAHSGAHYRQTRREFLAWLGDYLEKTAVNDPAVIKAYQDAAWYMQHSILGPLWSETKRLAERPFGHLRWRLHWLLRLALMRCLSPETYNRVQAKLTLAGHSRTVLAIIGTTQPVKQMQIEKIIPGDATEAIRDLLDHEMIDIARGPIPVGDAPVFVTTQHFLNFYRIDSIDELSTLDAPEFVKLRE